MDGTQFDTLAKRLSTTPLTRDKALRGMAAGAAALVGVTLAREPSAAAKKKKIRICVCAVCGCDDLPDQKQAENEGQEDPAEQALRLHGPLPTRRQRLHRLCSGQ